MAKHVAPAMPLSWFIKNAWMFCHMVKVPSIVVEIEGLPYRIVISPKT